jgi:hypothetical protein
MAYESFQDMTHKQLATIVTVVNRNNSREFENPEEYKSQRKGNIMLTPQQAERQGFTSGILVCILCGLLYLLFQYWGKM